MLFLGTFAVGAARLIELQPGQVLIRDAIFVLGMEGEGFPLNTHRIRELAGLREGGGQCQRVEYLGGLTVRSRRQLVLQAQWRSLHPTDLNPGC
jgi:hypothetical protein